MVICEFENGKRAPLRHATTSAIVSNGAGQVLLVKRAEFLVEGGKWALPGGYMDTDETLTEAITREIKEETGYEVGGLELFRVITIPNRPGEDRQNLDLQFTAVVGEKAGEGDDESTDIKWFDATDIPWVEMAFDHGESLQFFFEPATRTGPLPLLS